MLVRIIVTALDWEEKLADLFDPDVPGGLAGRNLEHLFNQTIEFAILFKLDLVKAE